MAIDCSNPSALANAARCFEQCIPLGFQPALETYLLAVLAGASLDPQTLINESNEWCCVYGLEQRIKAYLLCQIAAAGGASV